MTIIQFVTEMIKCLSEFQADWKALKDERMLKDKMPFADWLDIFSRYAIKSNEPF